MQGLRSFTLPISCGSRKLVDHPPAHARGAAEALLRGRGDHLEVVDDERLPRLHVALRASDAVPPPEGARRARKYEQARRGPST